MGYHAKCTSNGRGHYSISILLLVLSILINSILINGCSQNSSNTGPENISRIVVLCAFTPELNALLAKMNVRSTEVVCGRTCHIGTLGGKNVILAASGISMVNAAMMSQALIMRFSPDAIIFTGVAGGINPDLNVCDVYVAEEWSVYQEQLYARDIPDGWDTSGPGEPFYYPNFNMIFPFNTKITSVNGDPDVEESIFWMPVDEMLFYTALNSLADVKLKRCKDDGECLDNEPKVAIGGKAGSGTTFVDNLTYCIYLADNFQINAVDMESAAVAQVARVNEIPFIAIRAMSDQAGLPSNERQFLRFAGLAAENATIVLSAFLAALS